MASRRVAVAQKPRYRGKRQHPPFSPVEVCARSKPGGASVNATGDKPDYQCERETTCAATAVGRNVNGVT